MRYFYSQWKFPIALVAMGAFVVSSAVIPSYSLAASTTSVAAPIETQPSQQQADANTSDKLPAVDLKAVSYILGLSVAQSMHKQNFRLQTDDFVSGFRTAITGQSPKYTNDEMKKVMMAYQKQQMEKFYAEQARMREEASKSQAAKVSKQAIEVNDSTFSSLVLESDKPVLVDFGASWCGACQKLDPVIQELAKELNGKAVVTQVDVDTSPQLAQYFGIEALPTLLIFKNGKLVDKVVGVASKADLLAKLIPQQKDS